MAADATDSNAVVPHRLSDLSDVDAATVTSSATEKSLLVWDNTADEWKAVAPAANIAAVATADADGTYGSAEADLINELKTKVNLLLVACKARGIVTADA